jgi:O-antigen/teichoic acid export membrane protein
MHTRIWKDAYLYALSSLFSGGLNLILLPLYTRMLPPELYGLLELLTLISTLANLTVALEVSQALARFFPEADARGKIEYASTALMFTCLTFSLALTVGLFFSQSLTSSLLGQSQYLIYWLWNLLNMGLNTLYYFMRNQLRWQLRSRAYALSSIASGLATILAIFISLLILKQGLLGLLWSQALGLAVGLAIATYYARDAFAWAWNKTKLLEMLHFSSPLVFSSIGVWVALYVDRLMIKAFLSLEDVGIYAAAYRIASSVSLVISSFQGALTPLVYTHHTKSETPFEISKIFSRFLSIVLTLWFILSVLSPEIMSLIAPPSYAQGRVLIPLLTGAVIIAGMYVFAPGLGIAKRSREIALLNIAGALLNLGLNYWGIPHWGLLGSAFATLVSSTLVVGSYMWWGQQYYHIPFARFLLPLVGIAVLLVMLSLAWSFWPRAILSSFSILILVVTWRKMR